MSGAHHRRLPYHLLAVLLGVLLVLVGSAALDAPAQAATRETRELERDVVALVNIERAKQGLGALSIEKDIRKVARAHSERMADADDLHHNPDFSSQITDWKRVAENVGVGPSVTRIHEALMDSEGHRANILDDQVTEIGVGVELRNGRIWITQNFRRPSSGASESAPTTTTLGDVSSANVHADSIESVVGSGVAETCGTSRYCPAGKVSRGEFAGMLVRALDLPAASGGTTFDDVSAEQRDDVESLYAAGLTEGCSTSSFCPDRNLTREQMATFLSRALELEPVDASQFGDIQPTHAGSIGALYEAGIVTGCTSTSYCPTKQVTRAQTASMVARHLG